MLFSSSCLFLCGDFLGFIFYELLALFLILIFILVLRKNFLSFYFFKDILCSFVATIQFQITLIILFLLYLFLSSIFFSSMIRFTVFLFNLCLSCHLFSCIYWFLLVHSYLNNCQISKVSSSFVSFSFILSLRYLWLPKHAVEHTGRWLTLLRMSERKHSAYSPSAVECRRAYICDANSCAKQFLNSLFHFWRISSIFGSETKAWLPVPGEEGEGHYL